MNQATLVKKIRAQFPTASGILIFGSQANAVSLSPTTDIDLLITVPIAQVKHLHKIAFNRFTFDINLLSETNLATILVAESAQSFYSSLLDAIITGNILFDTDDMLASHKELAGLLARNSSLNIAPEKLIQLIDTAEKIATDIRFKRKSIGQFLLVSLLFNKLMDIELMLNLGTQVVSAKYKSALLKMANPSLYKKLNDYAFKLDHPDYIKKIYTLASGILAGYSDALKRRNLYTQPYVSGKRIGLDLMTEQDVFHLSGLLKTFISKNRLKDITFYYLITPFKLGLDYSHKLVIKGRSLDKVANFLTEVNQTAEIAKPARHQLSGPLFGGEEMLGALETLLSGICRLLLKKTARDTEGMLFGINFILTLEKASPAGTIRLTAFSAYLCDTWMSLSYDSHLTPYQSLPNAKERTIKNFELLLKENKRVSRFIKNTVTAPAPAATQSARALFEVAKKFTRHKAFRSPGFRIAPFELKKALCYTDDPLSAKRWFIYRKVLELIFLNARIHEKDFSFIAFLVKKNG